VNDTVDPDSAIGREARNWALSVFGEPFPPERSQALRQWLDADPRHAHAYGEAERLMTALGDFDAAAATAATVSSPRRAPRWGWAAAATALAASIVLAVAVAPRPVTYTSGSAVRTVALNDGSTALLAPGSALRTTGWRGERRYVLERGEALFDVRHAQGRRFEVAAGSARVTVLGTRFDVRKGDSGEIRVAVQRGLVAVDRADGRRSSPAARLGPGDVVTLGGGGATRGRIADPSLIGAWADGRLSYASAPLGDILADLNAQGRVRVTATPEAARLRLTASLRADQGEAFVASLPGLLPVMVETRPDGARRITTRAQPSGRLPSEQRPSERPSS
jgi:transmembrane sensor